MTKNKEVLSALAEFQLAVASEAKARASYAGKEWKNYAGVNHLKSIEEASDLLMRALDEYVDDRIRGALSQR